MKLKEHFKTAAARDPDFMRKKRAYEKKTGVEISSKEFEESVLNKRNDKGGSLSDTGTSIFDPVLCETMYAWFTNADDSIIDPFAGGSVRGIVAVKMGRYYTGVDLRKEQVDANIENAYSMCDDLQPVWICGDSDTITDIAYGDYDFIMTCPPYGDLEKYSDDENDLSNMDADDFDAKYESILNKTASMLKNDRFACIVVGNYRDNKGYLRDLVGLTVRSMENAGCRYYNDIVFVTPCGTLPIRAGRSFQGTRKIGKTHQYVLIFVKGDPKKATLRLGECEIPDLSAFVDGEDDG